MFNFLSQRVVTLRGGGHVAPHYLSNIIRLLSSIRFLHLRYPRDWKVNNVGFRLAV